MLFRFLTSALVVFFLAVSTSIAVYTVKKCGLWNTMLLGNSASTAAIIGVCDK